MGRIPALSRFLILGCVPYGSMLLYFGTEGVTYLCEYLSLNHIATVNNDILDPEQIHIDSMGYPKFPTHMFAGESLAFKFANLLQLSAPLTTTL